MPLSSIASKFRLRRREREAQTQPTATTSVAMKGAEAFPGKVTLKYFQLGNIGGRGSVVRYMLYVHDIAFEDIQIPPDESWLQLKEQLQSSGHNPCGSLPVMYVDDKPFFGHVPIVKYIAAKLGAVSDDPDVLYRSNVVLDEYTDWRKDWADCLFEEEKQKTYREKREKLYALMEKLYSYRTNKETPFFMGMEKPGYDDLCVYSIIYDDQAQYGEMSMDATPTLKGLYDKIRAIPRIDQWVKEASAAGQ